MNRINIKHHKWIHITDNWYIDKSSIEKEGEKVFVWQMLNSQGTIKSTQTPTLSSILLYEYDCNASTYTVHVMKLYDKEMGKGQLIGGGTVHGEMADVPTNSTAQLLYKEACNCLTH